MNTLKKSEYFAIKACIKPGITNLIHYLLFHGYIENKNKDFTYSSFLHSLKENPICLSKSGIVNPPVIMPASSLIVNNEVKKILEKFNIQTRPVKINKLVDCWYNVGDLSFYTSLDKSIKHPFADVEEEFVKSLPNSEKFQKDSIEYYEVLAYKIVDLNKLESNDEFLQASCKFKDFVLGSMEIDFKYIKRLLKLYPILWSIAVLVPADIFSEIRHFFDFSFFTTEIIHL